MASSAPPSYALNGPITSQLERRHQLAQAIKRLGGRARAVSNSGYDASVFKNPTEAEKAAKVISFVDMTRDGGEQCTTWLAAASALRTVNQSLQDLWSITGNDRYEKFVRQADTNGHVTQFCWVMQVLHEGGQLLASLLAEPAFNPSNIRAAAELLSSMADCLEGDRPVPIAVPIAGPSTDDPPAYTE